MFNCMHVAEGPYHSNLEVIILARPAGSARFWGRFWADFFRPQAGLDRIFFGFGQAKNDFLVYFLAQPVLARKSPLI